jgi:hypothetical protein
VKPRFGDQEFQLQIEDDSAVVVPFKIDGEFDCRPLRA